MPRTRRTMATVRAKQCIDTPWRVSRESDEQRGQARRYSGTLSRMTHERPLSAAELAAFVKRVETLRAEGLTVAAITIRLGVKRSTLDTRMQRWRKSSQVKT